MNRALSRAYVLYQQSRYDLAELEVRRVLGELPQEAEAHYLLALCLVEQDKLDEAQAEAEQAILLAPDGAYAHYGRSIVMHRRGRLNEAESSAREAVRLEPENAEYWGRAAGVLYSQHKWQASLDASLEGLSHDPENETCSHLQAMALTKLGRQGEAVSVADDLLSRLPDDARAHANKGWSLLHQRQPRQALEHFRESLRIDPSSEYAQLGLVEALKARNPIYRWLLAYLLWMARLSSQVRWGVIIGGYLGYRFLLNLSRVSPEWAPWVAPIIWLYLAFVIITWFAIPLFNLLLRFNRFGWYALTHDARRAAECLAVCLGVFLTALVTYLVWDNPWAFLIALLTLGLALPIVTIFSCNVGWPRTGMKLFAGGMLLLAFLNLLLAWYNHSAFNQTIGLFAFGCFATPWVANYLSSVEPSR
ncbi:MAG: tetratricopeptide repeat protein [Pirellulales bacterium]|nr:tetratricopeptide repeat protein [Pirellulales bacterium]